MNDEQKEILGFVISAATAYYITKILCWLTLVAIIITFAMGYNLVMAFIVYGVVITVVALIIFIVLELIGIHLPISTYLFWILVLDIALNLSTTN